MKKLIGRIKMRMLKCLLLDICKRRDCGKSEFAEVNDPKGPKTCMRRDALLQWEAEKAWLFADDGINH